MTLRRIDADIGIDGTGERIKNAAIVYENEIIQYFGEDEHAPEAETTDHAKAIMPGLWDCHIHLTGSKNFRESPFLSPYLRAARVTWDLKNLIRSGFTSVREMGGIGVDMNRAVREESIIGPRIYGAGKAISMTGGHADPGATSEIPLPLISHIPGTVGEIADGPVGVQLGVRKQLRRGAEIIKVMASGGGLSKSHPEHSQYSLRELKALVEEADRAELLVGAHAHGRDAIENAIEAGVKTIEHGSYLDEDLCELMIEKDVILVPTTSIPKIMINSLHRLPPHAQDKAEELFDAMISSIQLAIKQGVKIAMGTDTGLSGQQKYMEMGTNAQELQYYVEYGMSELEAISTATGNARGTVGSRSEKAGILREGYQADFLVLEDNPLEDISILNSRENIREVIKRGQIY